jgi:protein-S-isoprenylcysteine O-methyltransferase Ste14
MPEFRITIRQKSAETGVPYTRPQGGVQRIKAALVTLLALSVAIGIFIAAFIVGSLIASILLVVVAVAVLAALTRWLFISFARKWGSIRGPEAH